MPRSAQLAGWLLVLAVWIAPATVQAYDEPETSLDRFTWGVGAGICTLVYTPLKIVYAATSIPLSGLVWLWSVGDSEIPKRMIVRATTGDYVVTPEHLKGQRRLTFLGPTRTAQARAGD